MYLDILAGLTAQKVPMFVHDVGEVSFEKNEETEKINDAIAWMGKVDSALLNKTVTLLNRLESWSMSFTHDPALATQEVAFEPCSTVFCQMVMSLYPLLLVQRRANLESGPYQNLVTLFRGWYARKAQDAMLEQLMRMQSDGERLPKAIGKVP